MAPRPKVSASRHRERDFFSSPRPSPGVNVGTRIPPFFVPRPLNTTQPARDTGLSFCFPQGLGKLLIQLFHFLASLFNRSAKISFNRLLKEIHVVLPFTRDTVNLDYGLIGLVMYCSHVIHVLLL